MGPTVLPLITADDARAADAAAIAAGDGPDVLMGRAAGHLARTVVATAGHGAGLRVDLVVGRGDNGGDGWAAAPRLAARGAHVRVIAPDGIDGAIPPAAARARAAWLAARGPVWSGPVARHLLDDEGRARADVVVDCLLGTGATGELRGSAVEAVAAIRAARAGGATVVACDLPSGIDADGRGAADGAVVADVTVTFGALKRGLVLAPGAAHAGRVVIAGLGAAFAAALSSPSRADRSATAPGSGTWWTLTAAGARPDPSDPLVEKRRRGVVLVVAGRVGSAGAAALAGRGALAAGAGLVTVAVPEPVRAEVASAHPALMTVGLPADAAGGLHADAVHALPLDGIDAIVAGPGLGTGPGAAAVVAHLLARGGRLVLDADALNVYRDAPDRLGHHPDGPGDVLVLTPHARELDRIGGAGAHDARASRVPELAARWRAHVIAKGPGTVVASPDGTVHVDASLVPALATGGSGDVLAGMLGAGLAGHPGGAVARTLARTVWWHAAAGRLAGAASGGRTDAVGVVDALPSVFARLVGSSAGGTVRDGGDSARLGLDELMGF